MKKKIITIPVEWIFDFDYNERDWFTDCPSPLFNPYHHAIFIDLSDYRKQYPDADEDTLIEKLCYTFEHEIIHAAIFHLREDLDQRFASGDKEAERIATENHWKEERRVNLLQQVTRQMQAGAYLKNCGVDDDEVKPRYILSCIIQIVDEYLPKIDELLRDKWHADNISVSKHVLPTHYRVKCVLDSPRKVFVFKTLVAKYGGKVVRCSFQKHVPDNDVLSASTAITTPRAKPERGGMNHFTSRLNVLEKLINP